MRKKFLCMILTLFMMTISFDVFALSGSFEEQAKLNEEVSYIKVVYETGVKPCTPEDNWCRMSAEEINTFDDYDSEEEAVNDDVSDLVPYANIRILNLSENFYVEAINKKTGQKRVFTTNDIKDGSITILYLDLNEVTTFNFNIYTSNKVKYPNELYRIITTTIPRYNWFATDDICEGIEEYYLCESFLTANPKTSDNQLIFEYKEKKNKKEKDKSHDNDDKKNNDEKFTEYIIPTTIGVSILVIGVITVIMVKRSKNEKNMH